MRNKDHYFMFIGGIRAGKVNFDIGVS